MIIGKLCQETAFFLIVRGHRRQHIGPGHTNPLVHHRQAQHHRTRRVNLLNLLQLRNQSRLRSHIVTGFQRFLHRYRQLLGFMGGFLSQFLLNGLHLFLGRDCHQSE